MYTIHVDVSIYVNNYIQVKIYDKHSYIDIHLQEHKDVHTHMHTYIHL